MKPGDGGLEFAACLAIAALVVLASALVLGYTLLRLGR